MILLSLVFVELDAILIVSAINFWRYSSNTIGKNSIPLWVFLFYPIGLLFYLKDISIEK